MDIGRLRAYLSQIAPVPYDAEVFPLRGDPRSSVHPRWLQDLQHLSNGEQSNDVLKEFAASLIAKMRSASAPPEFLDGDTMSWRGWLL